jgi:signal transduction histidine kinase
VRVNQFLADMNGAPIKLHLGRTIDATLPGPAAEILQKCVERVFETGEPVAQLALDTPISVDAGEERSWLINVYPVKTTSEAVRWVGAIVVEATQRKRAEEALRKTEKLAAAGRLAASIAHEINNPLEAVTNLLYLLRHHSSLDAQAIGYIELAQHEIARVAEMTQQTLRFYRQSSSPSSANIQELLDSVVALYKGKLVALQAEVTRQGDADVELYCFAGEMRQLFANLIGNAIDALGLGGRIRLTVRRSRSWVDCTPGVRVFVEDNGCGMTPQTRARIFEPFFTTKESTGTGLGLWVSSEILSKHKATVRVASRLDDGSSRLCGTVFMIFFPEDGIEVPQSPAMVAETEHA